MSLSRRNAASESAKKAVVRGSWLVKAHHHSEWAVVKYHSGPPFGTAPTSYEPRTTNHKKALAVVPPSRTSLSGLYTFTPSGHEIRHKRLTRFCASQSSFTYHALRVHHISGGPPFGTAPTSHEPRTTNHKKALTVVPPLLPNPGYLCLACIPSHHQVTRFGISDSHGFARRKAPSKPVPCLSQGTPRATNHESRTTKKH